MNTIYRVELSANMHPGEEQFISPDKDQYESDWSHCASTIEAIADFVVRIIGKNPDWMSVICEKLKIVKYCDREREGFFCWEGQKTFDVAEINKLIQREEDHENLYNYICENAEKYEYTSHIDDYQWNYDSEGRECLQEYIEF